MSTMTRPAPPRPHCTIPHHFPGRWVTWNQWDHNLQKNVHMCGVVDGHRSDIRYVRIKTTDGQMIRMSCGPLNPWPTR